MRPLFTIGIIFILVISMIIAIPMTGRAQYYYKDIWNTNLLNKEFNKLKTENIHQIVIKSFEDDGTPSSGFKCEKKIDKDFIRSYMESDSYITGHALTTTSYNEAGQVINVNDSSHSYVNRTEYIYERKKIRTVTTITHSDNNNEHITETHEYFYNSSGLPEKMIRKKNGKEYTAVNFIADKTGNIIEENEFNKGTKIKTYFYYYDEKNRLTDVVHNNERAKRLLPDYVYEYENSGNIIQLISTEEGSSNYFIWKYTYNDLNLRKTENCYSKERRLLGTITYLYR